VVSGAIAKRVPGSRATQTRVYGGSAPGTIEADTPPVEGGRMYIGIGTLLAIVLIILLLVLVF
jgi:hypothetical protein